jgi:hypothetical protein
MALNQLRGASKRDCEQKCGNAKTLHRGLLDCVQLLRLLSIGCRAAHEKTINIMFDRSTRHTGVRFHTATF